MNGRKDRRTDQRTKWTTLISGGGNAAFEAAASISKVSAHVDLWTPGKAGNLHTTVDDSLHSSHIFIPHHHHV